MEASINSRSVNEVLAENEFKEVKFSVAIKSSRTGSVSASCNA